MKKKIINTLIVSFLMLFTLAINVYGYENEIYKIDIPSGYKEAEYNGSSAFVKSEHTGVVIFASEAQGLKKNINTMSKSDINKIIGAVFNDNAEVISKGKEKLGKAKAIKARATFSDTYMDAYVLVSDKHILLVSFMAPSESELDSEEFVNIQKSFVMKEKTTNTTLIRIGIVLLVIIGIVIKFLRGKGIINNILGLIRARA